MGKPHKHAEFIKAWADGADIQYLNKITKEWVDCFPAWSEDSIYRIKPEPVYPESSLTDEELSHIYLDAKNNPAAFRAMAKAAVKKHCQDQEKEGK